MDYSSAPVPTPDSEKALVDNILMDTYTYVSALLLFATFLVVVTRFRLWHTNKFLKKIPELVNQPVYSLIQQSIGYVAAYQNQNDLFLIWVVILFIAYDNVFTFSCYSLFERASYRWSREFTFLYNCVVTLVMITQYKAAKEFLPPLLVLISLVLAKFFIRIVSFVFAENAYGLENVNLVAGYMKSEHKLSDSIDPTSMKGYKYLVMGEEKIKSKIRAPDYSPEIELTADVITVEKVWRCKEGLLHPSVDKDGSSKDACLSFALFKLLRRRHFGYRAAEAQQPKTKQLIFDGLLFSTADEKEERVFRVVKMELGFLRDLIFTRYPVGFAFGFPVCNLLLVGIMIGVTIWFSIIAFNVNNTNINLYIGNHNVDYFVTKSLLILIILMDLFEVLTYVFCDWTRVMMICRNVKCNSSDENPHEEQPWRLFGYKVLALFCKKPRLSLSVKTTLGQYSLLTNCRKTCVPWDDLISICGVSKIKVLRPGVKKSKAVVPLTKGVKIAIFNTLVRNRGELTDGILTDGKAALRRMEEGVYEDLKWTLNPETPVHTIMVWHIATSLCEFHQKNVGESIKSDHEVATHLSNYCAYLVAFLPDLLPLTSTLVKCMFEEIVKETSEFFGRKPELEAKYNELMSSGDGGQKIINLGSKLAKYLIRDIPDDAQRWKLMADFWSEFILYLAPKGSTRVHIEELGNGSEFITHLWALLYHAGIIDTTSAEYHP